MLGLEEVGYIHSTQAQLCTPVVIINQMRLQACYRHRTLLTNILMIANLKLKKTIHFTHEHNQDQSLSEVYEFLPEQGMKKTTISLMRFIFSG